MPIVFLILVLVGTLPTWPHNKSWGYWYTTSPGLGIDAAPNEIEKNMGIDYAPGFWYTIFPSTTVISTKSTGFTGFHWLAGRR